MNRFTTSTIDGYLHLIRRPVDLAVGLLPGRRAGPSARRREHVATAILDIDGTLVDTNYHHTIAWFRAFTRHEIVLPIWRIHRHIGMGGDRELADAWTTSADVDATKPEPDLVQAAISRVGADPAQSVMVGDTPWDAKAALGADVGTLAVMTGCFAEQELRGAGAVAVSESVAELRERLDETVLR